MLPEMYADDQKLYLTGEDIDATATVIDGEIEFSFDKVAHCTISPEDALITTAEGFPELVKHMASVILFHMWNTTGGLSQDRAFSLSREGNFSTVALPEREAKWGEQDDARIGVDDPVMHGAVIFNPSLDIKAYNRKTGKTLDWRRLSLSRDSEFRSLLRASIASLAADAEAILYGPDEFTVADITKSFQKLTRNPDAMITLSILPMAVVEITGYTVMPQRWYLQGQRTGFCGYTERGRKKVNFVTIGTGAELETNANSTVKFFLGYFDRRLERHSPKGRPM